jgi:FMN reductase
MLIVGIGGTQRPGSSSETALRIALAAVADRGARTMCFAASQLELPMYNPSTAERSENAQALVAALRSADGVLLSSPGYHGSISGLVKNALDYVEDMVGDQRPYLDGLPVGCISVAYGWQASVNTLRVLRDIAHALRGIPTSYGAALNASVPLFDDGVCVDEPARDSLHRVGSQVFEMGRYLMRSRQ